MIPRHRGETGGCQYIPAERALVTELFDRLATLENAPRDPQAESLIRDGLRRAPNAPFSLVQTLLLQDEALKQADARIQELESELGGGSGGGGAPAREPPSFLDSMRDALLGRPQASEPPRAGSVPSVRPADAPRSSAWGASQDYRSGAQPMAAAEPMRPGGSFLGTAAATAAGVIGGSLLANSMRGMMGGHGHSAAAFDPSAGGKGASPWAGSASGGELSRQAGVDDIGHSPSSGSGSERRHGVFDTAADDSDHDLTGDDDDDDGFDDDDFDGGGGGDSDVA